MGKGSDDAGAAVASGCVSSRCEMNKTKVETHSGPAQFLVCLAGVLETATY
jgi:hypothetical protein